MYNGDLTERLVANQHKNESIFNIIASVIQRQLHN